MTDRYLFPSAVFIILLSLFADHLAQPTISMVGADAPDTIYSGERALTILTYLLPGDQPHPTGSLENKKVKKRITEWLSKEEITFEEQHAWGCHPDRGRCAWVENIVATVPGTVEGPYVALMAHYDSVQASPGAGDDGLGTAIIMEIARMLKQQEGNRNPLMLVITDGEENVLMGARAFFSQHPLADQIGVVLNMEGTGSKGQSRLFRTSGGNADALSAYRQFSAHPLGSSFAGELFKLLPSDTDMTVASQYGLPSADIGFSGQGNHHYHTMGDNTRNMDPMTVQHHGDNLYAMVRGLINQDLNVLSSDVQIYDNIYGYFFTWTRHVDQAILLIAFFVLVASTMPIRQGIFGRLLSPLLLFVAIALTMAVVFVGLHFIRGETPFRPAFEIPYRMLLFGVPSLVGLLTARWLNQYWELEQFVTGIWWFWWLLAVTLVFIAPNAAYILTVPVLCGATLIFVGRWLGQGKRQYFYLLSLVIVVPFSLVKVGQLNEWQNYWLVLITVPFFALCLSVVMPFVRGPLVNPAILVASLVVVAGAGLSLYLPSYSAEKPHTMNYQVIQNQDSEKAWLQYLSFNAPPSYIMRAFDHEEVIYPWGDKVIDDLSSDTTFSEVDSVQVEVLQQLHKGKRDVQIMLLGNQKAMWMGLVIPPHALLSGFTLDGMTFDITPAWWSDWQENHVLEFRGVQEKQVDVVLHFDSGSETKAWVFEVMSVLPGQFRDDLDAREGRALPIHDGDRFIVFREVTL